MPPLRVRDLMSSPVYTIAPETALPEIERLMQTRQIRHLPVVDRGHVVGMVAEGDLRAAPPADPALPEPIPATALMSRPVVTIMAEARPVEATQLMLRHRIGGVPVIQAGRLVGIITESDIFRAIIGSQ